uniref:Anaphase-promoting complex subunit 4 WD40 domain-containing protein n=1 Tax=Oryza meridionalis TaxID=40149 RepID=A0A0E0CSC4_9ORYZ
MAEEQMEEASTAGAAATPFQLQFDKPIPFQIKMAEWNPEKDLLAMVTDDSKVVLHRFNWQRLWTISPGKCITSICWSPDGKIVALGTEDGLVLLHDVENGKMLRRIKSHDVAIVCLNWAEDELLSRTDKDGLLSYEDRTARFFPPAPVIPRIGGLSSGDTGLADENEESIQEFSSASCQRFNILCSGDKGGCICFSIFGIFPVGKININEVPIHVQSSGNKTSYRLQDASLSKVCLSGNLHQLVLLCPGKLIDFDNLSHSNHISAGLHCLHLDTSIFFNRKNELHQISQQASSIQDLVEVVRSSLSMMAKQWSSAMNLFNEKFGALPSLIAAHGMESSSEDEFMSLLFGTRTSPALHQFLVSSLGEAALKRIAKAVDSAGRELRVVVSEHLQTCGTKRPCKMALTISEHWFQNFFSWVLKCVKILLSEPTDQVPAANSELVVLFLKFLLDKDPIKQLLDANQRFECDLDTVRHLEQLVVLGGFADTHFLEKTLMKQFNELDESLEEAFSMPFTTISSQIHCQELLPLYPIVSSVDLSSTCTLASVSFYKDEDSQNNGSSYSLTDYICFKIPDGSLNLKNCIGVIKDFSNSSASGPSSSGFLLHIPDEYECVDVSLYKMENFSFVPLSRMFPSNIYSVQELSALELQLDTDYGKKVRSIPHAVSTPLATSSFYLYIYKLQFSGKPLIIGGKPQPGLCLASISQIIVEKVPLANDAFITSNFVCDSKSMLLGLSNGHLQVISWNAEFSDSFKLGCSACSSNRTPTVGDALVFDPPSLRENSDTSPAPCCTGNSAIIHVELSVKLRLLVALYSGCQIGLCAVGKKGLKQTSSIRVERWLNTDDAMCTSVASDQQILAVGCSRGVVDLYDLAENARHIRTISLYDWGYSVEDTGPVTCISWTPDNCAFAVGWKFRGLTVWSVSGCRLMCTIRQTGSNSASSPMVKPSALKFEPLMGGTSHIQWDDYGYKLFAVEESLSERILAFSFAKCCLNRGLSGTTYTRQILYGEDRILLASYISQNWPVLHVVASNDGMYLAVAGSHGLVLYDLRNKRWRVFGDVTQEQKIQCKGLSWLGKIVIVCNYIESSNTYELLFFPRYHLDYSSLLYRKSLLGRPIVMDVFQDYILVTYSPFDVHIFHVLSTVRELSIMSPKSPPVSMRFIPEPTDEGKPKHDTNGSSDLSQQPSRCLILRMNGELSVLDMDDGHEQSLTNSVELFWVTCSQYEEKGNLIKEVSWLDYGHKGMQVWYPSHGENPFKQEDFLQLDPELEFDREVYPLGLLPNSFHALNLLLKPKQYCIVCCGISFSQSASKNQLAQKNEPAKKSLLDKTCDLLRNFPEYMDVVVSVARKTDGRHWADLFHAAGRSTEMFEECFQRRWYRTAACYILVIAKLEGPAVSQYCALRLLQATLDESLYELAGELVRFLLRSGRDFENATTDSEKLSPRFLSYFQLRSPFKRQSSDLRSNSMKELSPHIASVMNILENHASYLMSGKELSKLVAFVKGTQFDLVEYLQRERLGSARLENFASALELIGQKLQMNTLQSRLDAEFLLAHMCSVKFKEWIVVLATLLRRAEVLVDLFRHDLRLWKAYNITLQSHDVFREYLDLLNTLEEELSSVSDLTLQNRPVS